MTAIARLLRLVPSAPQTAARMRHDLPPLEAFTTGSDDAFVNTAVKSALARDAGLAHAGIHVSTCRGVVQLSGFVATRAVKSHAAGVARGVAGVRAVRNDMRLA
jgi:osmotically-inducible protein OsmY